MVANIFSKNEQNVNQGVWESLDTELAPIKSSMRDIGVGLGGDLYTLNPEENQITFHLSKKGHKFDLPMNVTEGLSIFGKYPILSPIDDPKTKIKLPMEVECFALEHPPHITEGQKMLYSFLADRIEQQVPEEPKMEATL